MAVIDEYEEFERTLDPDRGSEQRRAVAEVVFRLQRRGVLVSRQDGAEALEDLLSAVERFEAAVEAHGGDLMVDDLRSSRPDDGHFVVPRRAPGEGIRAYLGRIDDATGRLRRHPNHPD
jgi:hypothetical protein